MSLLSSFPRCCLLLLCLIHSTLCVPRTTRRTGAATEQKSSHRQIQDVEQGVKRRKIDEFAVRASPIATDLTDYEASQFRNIIESFLDDFFANHVWDPPETSVKYIGLVGVQSKMYFEDTQTIELVMGGLVYFNDQSIVLPTESDLSDLVLTALSAVDENGDSLLQLVQNQFSSVETVDFGSMVSSDTSNPTTAPTSQSDMSVGQAQRTPESPSKPTPKPSMALLIAVIAGALFVTAGAIGLVHRYRNKKVVTTAQVLDKDDNSNLSLDDTYHEDDDLSPKQNEGNSNASPTSQKHPSESTTIKARAPFPPESPVTTSRKEFGRNRDPNFVDRIISATTSLPARMMLASHSSNLTSSNHATDALGDDMEGYHNDSRSRRVHSELTDEHSDAISSAVSSDFDSTVLIEPHIISVDDVESFEHQRRVVSLKKDMMGSQDAISPYWRGKVHSNIAHCALKPTDISASSLAANSRPRRDVDSDSDDSIFNRLELPRALGNTNQANRHGHPAGAVGYPKSDTDDTFGTVDDLWDPDDTSMGDAASDLSGGFQTSVENRDEQSLLQHSLRNESYKMQRLRTPTNIARQRQAKASKTPGRLFMGWHSSSSSEDDRGSDPGTPNVGVI